MKRNEIPKQFEELLSDVPHQYVNQYFMLDPSGKLRIKTGKMNCGNMYAILKSLYKDMTDDAVCKELGLPKCTMSNIKHNRRQASFKNPVIERILETADDVMSDRVLEANGFSLVTGKTDSRRVLELFEIIRKKTGLTQKQFGKEFGLGEWFFSNMQKREYRRSPIRFSALGRLVPVLTEGTAGRKEVNVGELLAANYCYDAAETTSQTAETTEHKAVSEPVAEKTVRMTVAVKSDVPVASSNRITKRIHLPKDAVVRSGHATVVNAVTDDLRKATVQAANLLTRDFGLSDSKADAFTGKVFDMPVNGVESKLLRTYRNLRLNDADECSLTLTRDEILSLTKRMLF